MAIINYEENTFIANIELFRTKAIDVLDPEKRSQKGQYFTPINIAMSMASMASMAPNEKSSVKILDPGAGAGILAATLIAKLIYSEKCPKEIHVTTYENDNLLIPYLNQTLTLCKEESTKRGVKLTYDIFNKDFIETATQLILDRYDDGLFDNFTNITFDTIIINPPYKKISSQSETRRILKRINIETSNLYTAFVSLAIKLLCQNGHLIAITPRSFCNGTYFKVFRDFLYKTTSFKQIHLFNSRKKAFIDDGILQENIIFHLIKDNSHQDTVLISSNDDPSDDSLAVIEVPYNLVVDEEDPKKVIHIINDELAKQIIQRTHLFSNKLSDLNIDVSTGKIVDFRAIEFLRKTYEKGTVPLIYPVHFQNGLVSWPSSMTRKPEAILRCQATEHLLVDNGCYVLTKRFSPKEEPKRVIAALYAPDYAQTDKVGFENHLNYFHTEGRPLNENFARGLAVFLNSTIVDKYFRIFNGHTQVNANDLRSLRYPNKEQIENIGKLFHDGFPKRNEIDEYIERNILAMSETMDPIKATTKIEEAISILGQIGLPKEQQNERSGLTFLALLNLKPDMLWKEAKNPLVGITEMMNFFETHYGKKYAPNTRETVRRFTVHQFVQAGIVIPNPDKPRPINSPHYVYQIEPSVLKLVRDFRTEQWSDNLQTFMKSLETLQERYAQKRKMQRISIKVSEKHELTLSPCGQNELVKLVIEEFCSRFTPGAKLIYLGDTEDKWAYFDRDSLGNIGVKVSDEHGKMPDIVIYDPNKNWLILIEAVTSHGPINPKRKIELEELFKECTAGLVFVTTFLTRRMMVKYLSEIAWETEVWIAESPDHMIHFNGERFLGPY